MGGSKYALLFSPAGSLVDYAMVSTAPDLPRALCYRSRLILPPMKPPVNVLKNSFHEVSVFSPMRERARATYLEIIDY